MSDSLSSVVQRMILDHVGDRYSLVEKIGEYLHQEGQKRIWFCGYFDSTDAFPVGNTMCKMKTEETRGHRADKFGCGWYLLYPVKK